jgi:hypothetical protein
MITEFPHISVIGVQRHYGDQQNRMDGNKIVHFELQDEEGLVEFRFPDEACMSASTDDVARSMPLQDMLDSATASGDTTLTLPSAVECRHLWQWCQAVQVGAGELPQEPGSIVQCLEVLSHISDMIGLSTSSL